MMLTQKRKYLIFFGFFEVLIIFFVPLLFHLFSNYFEIYLLEYPIIVLCVIACLIFSLINRILVKRLIKTSNSSSQFKSNKSNIDKKEFRRVTVAKICPKCNNLSDIGAEFCRYCGSMLKEKGIICPECSKYINDIDADTCGYCGATLTEKGIICPNCSEFTHIEDQDERPYCEHCGKRIENISNQIKIKVSRVSESID